MESTYILFCWNMDRQWAETLPQFPFWNNDLIIHQEMSHIVEPVTIRVILFSNCLDSFSQGLYDVLWRLLDLLEPEEADIIGGARSTPEQKYRSSPNHEECVEVFGRLCCSSPARVRTNSSRYLRIACQTP